MHSISPMHSLRHHGPTAARTTRSTAAATRLAQPALRQALRQALLPALLPALLLAATTTLTAQDWVQAPATGPSPRQLPRLAFDLARGQTVLFGGYERATSAAAADTWTFDGTTWTQRTPANVPPSRDTHAMSYDLTRGVVTMFGGVDSGSFTVRGDTWEWNGVDWTQRATTVTPGPRFGAAMAFDSARGVHVLFGGSSTTALLADTWEWNGTVWTPRMPATVPPMRTNHGMVFDSARNRIVMFGGTGSGQSRLADTWEYDGVDWRAVPVPAAAAPAARTGLGLAYDFVRRVTVLYGGLGASGLLGDTWEYDGVHWYRLQQATVPGGGGRTNVAMTFDALRLSTTMFGGAVNNGDRGDTWLYGGAFPSFATYAAGCAGSAGVPRLSATVLPGIGGSLRLQLDMLPAAAPVSLVLGLAPLDAVLPSTPCRVVVQPLLALGLANVGGSASFTAGIPNDPTLRGLTLYLQGAVVDAGANPLGLTLTNGGRAVLN